MRDATKELLHMDTNLAEMHEYLSAKHKAFMLKCWNGRWNDRKRVKIHAGVLPFVNIMSMTYAVHCYMEFYDDLDSYEHGEMKTGKYLIHQFLSIMKTGNTEYLKEGKKKYIRAKDKNFYLTAIRFGDAYTR